MHVEGESPMGPGGNSPGGGRLRLAPLRTRGLATAGMLLTARLTVGSVVLHFGFDRSVESPLNLTQEAIVAPRRPGATHAGSDCFPEHAGGARAEPHRAGPSVDSPRSGQAPCSEPAEVAALAEGPAQ